MIYQDDLSKFTMTSNTRSFDASVLVRLENKSNDDDWDDILYDIAKMIWRNQIHSGSRFRDYVLTFSTFVRNVGAMQSGYHCLLVNGKKRIRFIFFIEDY